MQCAPLGQQRTFERSFTHPFSLERQAYGKQWPPALLDLRCLQLSHHLGTLLKVCYRQRGVVGRRRRFLVNQIAVKG